MTLSRSDLQRLLESLRTADGIELVRNVAERMLQELIEAELSGGSAPGGMSTPTPAPPSATATGTRPWPSRPATWTWRYRNCAAAASSPGCWIGGAASNRLCMRSSWRRTCTGCPSDRSTT